jgi:GDP/UDP-N,N'-diacetylbacillosamine 2-epimerase (hydrolysing)
MNNLEPRKICVITSTRADFGLLRWVMQEIKDDTELKLQIIATGMHLSPEFGLTYHELEQHGFQIDRKVEMLTSSDTAIGIAKSMGLGMIGLSDAINELKPDIILVLGDRFEIFSAVSTALVARIPVAHLHGGELTMGAFDESFRHSITKMSHLHFVATEEYRQRVIQLGEQPETVHLVGGLGVDCIMRTKLLSRSDLESSLGFKMSKKNLLITYHPVTLGGTTAFDQMQALLNALSSLEDTELLFTLPNADTSGRILTDMICQFVAQHNHAHAYSSLGSIRYLSCIKYFDGVIGNSSSGLLEVPSFKKGTINIGDRQAGRLQAKSVINCLPNTNSIKAALDKLYSSHFQKSLSTVSNPYGKGGASKKIVKTIKSYKIEGIVKKKFYDIPIASSRDQN